MQAGQSGIAFGEREACVTGELLDATPFEGRNLSTTLRHSISLFSEQFLLSLMPRVG